MRAASANLPPALHRYFILNKPYGMLSQFVGGAPGLRMLGELDFDFPEGSHAIGRLDYESEGILLLTTDTRITKLLFQSPVKHRRTYLVQAYKAMSDETIEQLRTGITIPIKGGINWTTTPCEVTRATKPTNLPASPTELPVTIPQTWLTITLTEGKYRQVRKMLKHAHHKCMRLIRTAIEDVVLDGLQPGEIREVSEMAFFSLLKIEG